MAISKAYLKLHSSHNKKCIFYNSVKVYVLNKFESVLARIIQCP